MFASRGVLPAEHLYSKWLQTRYWLPVHYKSSDPQYDSRWYTFGFILDVVTNCRVLPVSSNLQKFCSQKSHKSVLASSRLSIHRQNRDMNKTCAHQLQVFLISSSLPHHSGHSTM